MFIIHVINQPRIDLTNHIRYSWISLLYAVLQCGASDWSWISLKSYKHNTQSITSVLLALSKKTSTSSMFWISSSFMLWTSWNEKTFIIWCFSIAINFKHVTTSVTIISIKNSYLWLDFCRPNHHCAIYHSLLLSHLALKFLKHNISNFWTNLFQVFTSFLIGIFLEFGFLFCSALLEGWL